MSWRDHYSSEPAARAAVVAEARTWIGTKWAHAHALKGVAVDCAQMLKCCYVATHLIDDFKVELYSPQWHLNREAKRFIEQIERSGGHQVAAPLAGDIAMYKFGRHAAHGAIVIDDHTIIHAYLLAGRVICDSRGALLSRLDSYWSIF
jgi:hypothetical protein